jgi:hypothetical protein
MSVMQLHPEHIAAVVGSCATYDRIRFEGLHARNLMEQARVLAQANAYSFEDRYGEETEPHEVTSTMINRWTLVPLTPTECLLALRCYEYQTCEYESWNDASHQAREAFDTLQATAIRALTRDVHHATNMWGISQPPAGSEGIIRIT